MIDNGKRKLLGVMFNVIDYESAIESIVNAAKLERGFAVTALAVHGTMTAVFKADYRYRLNSFDLVVPDGQPVRWGLNWLHGAGLRDRVYGPKLTKLLLQRCAAEGLPVYFYGTNAAILGQLVDTLRRTMPKLQIAGCSPSRFGTISCAEQEEIARRIRESGAKVTLAALGCPRQETWAHELRPLLQMPVLAVGAAVPFLAGSLPQAPVWMQRAGLEWLFRLMVEPRRLFWRYAILNPLYLILLFLQLCGLGLSREGRRTCRGPIAG
jgi:exopolysaccharide biosynthesis WecB/TagA/CpsF family protein